jgi:SAM-dependent methyltransferase
MNSDNWYDTDAAMAEWYDATQTGTDDVDFLRTLLQGCGPLRILEEFCGTGRILIPLLDDGHEVVGHDQSAQMIERARRKVAGMPEDAGRRADFAVGDATAGNWLPGFDLVILGANCFYELASAREQESCIASAAAALKPGGYLFLDNDHMEGELGKRWRDLGIVSNGIDWRSADGVHVFTTSETIWYDGPGRLWRARRSTYVAYPDGRFVAKEYVQQKHPVSVGEEQEWLAKHGFAIEGLFGDWKGTPYSDGCGRATFWARKV